MAGNLAAGPLAAAPAGVRYAVATASDDAALRRLLRENPTRGALSLSFEREPGYFHGAEIGGAEEQTIVARVQDRLVCLGRCTVRPGWLNGREHRIGYLGELRLDAAARGRVSILRQGYAFFREQPAAAAADFYFTSIAADNRPARRLLERGLPGFPRYSFLTEFVTLVLSPRRAAGRAAPDAAPADHAELAEFFTAEGRRAHLAAAWDAARLRSLEAHGLRRENFSIIRDSGRIVAAAALWDQRAFRQVVVRGYAPWLAGLRPLVNLAARLRGGPALPGVGATLAHALVSPLAITPGHETALPALVATLAREAERRGLAFLTLGFAAADPRLAVIRRRFSARAYVSRLYRVTWPDDPAGLPLDARGFAPDVALL